MKQVKWTMVMEGDLKSIKATNPTDLLPVISELKLHERDREAVTVFMLGPMADVIAYETISIGTMTATILSAREVFKAAINNNAFAVIIMHNHPSGDVSPSPADIESTRLMVQAGKILGIPVVDHLIVGPTKNFCSLRACGGGDELFS